MSPFLFVLSSHPLMRRLEDMRRRGELIGLKITQEDSQLFADDIVLFIQNSQREFEQAMRAIMMYKRAPGANLNIGKLVIIPMTHPIPQEWCADRLRDFGCA